MLPWVLMVMVFCQKTETAPPSVAKGDDVGQGSSQHILKEIWWQGAQPNPLKVV